MDIELKEWIQNSLGSFWDSPDRKLVDRKLKEECINHRFAFHIEKCRPVQFGKYYIDLEYNKMNNDEKSFMYNGSPKYIRPDILVHRRTDDLSDNLIALECKISYLIDNDKIKLRNLSLEGFRYKLCLGINYQPNKDYFLIYSGERNFNNPVRVYKNAVRL